MMLNLLADFTVIKPDLGLFFWSAIFFVLFWLIIGKFGFGPISDAIKTRETKINDALQAAEQAKLEMQNLNSENERLLMQAREERALMLKEAKAMKEDIIKEAKSQANVEAEKILQNARQEIENERKAAIQSVKNEIGNYALDVAEQLTKERLKDDTNQKALVSQMVDAIKLN